MCSFYVLFVTPSQVMNDSRPWLDMAHVVSNLNKLDAGIADKIW
jgi:hypothetical protein